MSLLRILLLVITVGATGQLSLAQSEQPEPGEAATDPAPARKQYQVEIIAFQYQGPDSSGDEKFDQLFVEDYFPREPFDLSDYQRIRENMTYTEIEHMAEALKRLRLAPQYSVMLNTAWVQPLLNKSEAIDVPLGYESRPSTLSRHPASQGPVAPRMSGSIRVYGDHLLFVDLKLKATLPRRPDSGDEEAAEESMFTPIIGTADPEPENDFEVFEISEKRRIKLEEFHYFDHPYIGAIVSVTRYDAELDHAVD